LYRKFSVSALLLFIILLSLPLFTNSFYIWQIITIASIYSVWAMSWDFFSGYTGQISFGHAFFIGVGGFFSAIINKRFGIDPWFTILMGTFVSGFLGLIVGILTLRLRGPYFAMITLALNLFISQLALILWKFTGGEEGIPGLDVLTESPLIDYYAALILCMACYLFLTLITKSKHGTILISIRENIDVAEACGVNTTLYKVIAFGISASIAGTAGGFHVHLQMHASYDLLQVMLSSMILIMCLFGGIGSITGPLFGAYSIFILNEMLRDLSEYRMLAFTLILFFTILYIPNGVFITLKQHIANVWKNYKLKGFQVGS